MVSLRFLRLARRAPSRLRHRRRVRHPCFCAGPVQASAQDGQLAAALNAAAIVGALASGYIADQFGRKPALFISSLMFTAGSFLMAGANSYKSLLLGRYIQGYGVGAGLLISPMFISEIAPPAFRGSLVTLSEVSLSLGVLLAYIVNVALSGLPNQWRWMLRLGAVPGVLLTLRILFLPESPRFLVGQGKEEEAKQVLRVVMDNEPESAADATLKEIKARAAEESGSTWSMLLHKGTLFAVLVGAVLAALQHAVGIESIIYHSPIIFEKAGIETKRHAMMGTVAMGCIKLVFETYALLNVDRIGRRPLLLLGSAGLTGAFSSWRLTACQGDGRSPASRRPPPSSARLSTPHSAISFSPITWLVLAEIFPAVVKGKAMSITAPVNRCTSFIAALTFSPCATACGGVAPLCLCGLLGLRTHLLRFVRARDDRHAARGYFSALRRAAQAHAHQSAQSRPAEGGYQGVMSAEPAL